MLHASASSDCSWNYGQEKTSIELMLALGTEEEVPVTWGPLAIAEHDETRKCGEGSPETECPKRAIDASLKESWLPDGRLQLQGAGPWYRVKPPTEGGWPGLVDFRVRESAPIGRYRFLAPKSSMTRPPK